MAIHLVRPGDSLWEISRTYRVSVETIMSTNGLQSSFLVPGLALYIPAPSLTNRLYQIKAGDTLWTLAREFETTVPLIQSANPTIPLFPLRIGEVIHIPTPQKMSMTTLGYFVPYSLASFFELFPAFADELTYVAVVSYSFTAEGQLYEDLPDEGIAEASLRRNVVPLLVVRNIVEGGAFSSENVGQVLETPRYRRRLIRDLVRTAEEKGYGGVSVDFEFIPPVRRKDFITFLRELKRSLGKRLLHVSVHSKTEDIATNPITGGHDYEEIGKVADIVGVMTMDYGYPGGPPNPVTPIEWLEEVIRYAVSLIDRKKLQVALPLYGYNWNLSSGEAHGLSQLAAQQLAISTKSAIRHPAPTITPSFDYWQDTGEHHVVWFDDIYSFDKKYKLIDYYDLLGVTFWETRLPFPQNWVYMSQHIHVQKKK